MSGRWIKFYFEDWLNGTSGLTLEEVGALIQITAMLYDRDNAIELARKKGGSYDYTRLARRLNTRSDKLTRLIASLVSDGKLRLEGDCITSQRVEREMRRRNVLAAERRAAALKRWR